jgi:hypothetical protein
MQMTTINLDEFKSRIAAAIPVGTVFNNPGRGTSEVVKIDVEKIAYLRGGSRFYVRIKDLYAAYLKFKGTRITTQELKEFSPEVFDSAARPAGHNCNCTFMFLVLERSGLASELKGSGVRGNPYSIKL